MENSNPIARYRKYIGTSWVDTGAGQIVRDVTTGATAEVMYYKRNFRDVTIYVKNVSVVLVRVIYLATTLK